MNPEEYEKMKERLEEMENDKAARLITDAETEEALREVRNDLEDKNAAYEELKEKRRELKLELHKTDHLKQERYKENVT